MFRPIIQGFPIQPPNTTVVAVNYLTKNTALPHVTRLKMWCFNGVSPRDSKNRIYHLCTILNRALRYNEDAGYTSHNIYYYIKLHV